MTASTLLQHATLGKPDHFGTYALPHMVDVRTYGAKIDGATDDATAINAALTAAGTAAGTTGKAIVYVPNIAAGKAIIGATLVVPSNVTFQIFAHLTRKALFTGNLIQNKAVTAALTASDGAITIGTNVITTALGATATVGQMVSVAGAGPNASITYGTISAVTETTITYTGTAAAATVSAVAVKVYNRDTNVHVVGVPGVAIDGGDNSGASGNALHHVRLAHVDRCSARELRFTSTGGKYAVDFGDVTDFKAIDIYLDSVSSDGVHIDGNSFRGVVERVWGKTGDNIVAITARTYPAYEDLWGDVADVEIRNVTLNGGNTKSVLLLAGNGTNVRRVTVDGIHGIAASGAYAVNVYDDTGTAATTGGTFDAITISRVDCVPGTTAQVYLTASSIHDLTLRDIFGDLSATTVGSQVNIAAGCVIEKLLIDGITARSLPANAPMFSISGTINRFNVSHVRLTATGANNNIFSFGGSASVAKWTVHGIEADINGGTYSVIAGQSSSIVIPTVEMTNVRADALTWLFAVGFTLKAYISNVDLTTVGSGIAFLYSTGNLRIVSGPFTSSNTTISVTAGGVVSVNSAFIHTDATKLTPSGGDLVWNTNSALAGVRKASALVVYDAGAVWRLVGPSFVSSGTAVLVAGTVTVADANITSTSRLRLTNAGTGGTVGVLSYSLNAGVGFTINSSSGADTSTVYYEVVGY